MSCVVAGCKNIVKNKAKSLCCKHYTRLLRGQDIGGAEIRKTGPQPRPLEDRFWAQVDKAGGPNACWPWTGHTNPRTGYGQIGIGGHGGETHPCHRVAFFLENDLPILWGGAWVLHHCDNKLCCNPLHLYSGTPKENSRDAIERNRLPRGSAKSLAKLTEGDVRQARLDYAAGGVSQKELAKRAGVSVMAMNRALRRETWTHVT
jgi:hypothetical protein